jgi:hypothetical protein
MCPSIRAWVRLGLNLEQAGGESGGCVGKAALKRVLNEAGVSVSDVVRLHMTTIDFGIGLKANFHAMTPPGRTRDADAPVRLGRRPGSARRCQEPALRKPCHQSDPCWWFFLS